ncbi:hypothetical protein DAH66_05090 [Sphingomonas koreensis]|jgi:hypothetical protein|uniref:Uncharacterized protein n=1 Tax=Sphingomonas koreensis TaxID=93064 RepID=A0A2M8W956_9SPHN|nr:hypothetical protein [Sphingomonas koreensis]PJI87444.1 hypothetical protein BDW16_0682 [Sphingomonas koreensis]RSU62832.1 hypothetical protein DAH56_02685 [Sphingomonas koreensis]RSU71543.1 hypothetical protein DAH55_00320 [Sphingomonas koreensis]RSY88822.1 hypothetical protein DAH66_05090 [Sphingomonas koreensis]
MKKQLTVTTAMAATLLALPGCSGGDDWNEDVYASGDTAICVDQEGKRVDDDRCGERNYYSGGGGGGSNAFLWYYLGRSSAVPYYGDSIRDKRYAGYGSYQPRPGANYGPAPASTRMTRSAAVSRGGFGSSGRSFGGGRS